MTLTLSDIAFLASSAGERLLEHLAVEDLSEANTLRLLTVLRRNYSPDEVGAALQMARLRLKAVVKFGDDARRMFFTPAALEQASDPLIRHYRAGMMGGGDETNIIDACCGIGADTLAFAHHGLNVLGLDIDPVRIEIARYNTAALGLKARFEVADVTDSLPPADAVFFDPARRDPQGNRIYDVERYTPPLSTSRAWNHRLITIKLSPGVDLAQLKHVGGRVEFISVNGDLKEAVLWHAQGLQGLRATLLTDEQVYHWDGGGVDDVPLSQPLTWLVEPDPSILRAGLVQDVAARFNGCLLDDTIAYFTTEEQPESPWLRSWRILDWMPFNLKKLRAYLRGQNVGSVTVKKRGTAVTPEILIPQLKLKGDNSRVLVLTRCQGKQIAIICET